MTNNVEPRIYVACLCSYNEGRLHGEWLDVPTCHESLYEMIKKEVLETSTAQNNEEWAIHDYEGFGPFKLHEYENLEHVVKYSQILEDLSENEIEPFTIWCQETDIEKVEPHEIVEEFRDQYRGEWDSEADYAENFFSESYDLNDEISYYIDYQRVFDEYLGAISYLSTTPFKYHIFEN